MKVIIYIFLYIFLTGLYFFSLSLFGCLWFPFKEVVTNANWFILYLVIFHWWLVPFSLMEYYEKHLNNLF
jgi:hypothetical protein